jgi:hypothetical protein
MSTGTVLEINRELANQINKEARSNPQSLYANKFVGVPKMNNSRVLKLERRSARS